MSPQAIRNIIDVLGVEKGIQVLNLFTAPDEWDVDDRLDQLGRFPAGPIKRICFQFPIQEVRHAPHSNRL